MKFATYQPWIYLHGGIEKSMLELINRSRHEWVIYTGHYEPANTFPGFSRLDVRETLPTTVNRSFAGVLKSSLQVARQRLPISEDTDGIVVWCDGVGDLITLRNNQLPLFNICCTPLRAVFDPVYEKSALAKRGVMGKLAYRLFKFGFRLIDRFAWKHYRGVVAISSEVKNRIVAGGLHDGGESMTLAYPGVNWQKEIDVRYEPFVLLPGRIMWTKNIEQGILAFLRAELPAPWRLVVAGFLDIKSQTYLEELRRLAGDGNVVEFIISPSDEEMKQLYKDAAFCLFTPLNEDWGIVPLEAMAAAKAVVANARGGPQESIIDGHTGYLLEPDDEEGWSASIRKLATQPDLMQSMGENAHAHVQRFSWDRFASQIDDALEEWVLQGRIG